MSQQPPASDAPDGSARRPGVSRSSRVDSPNPLNRSTLNPNAEEFKPQCISADLDHWHSGMSQQQDPIMFLMQHPDLLLSQDPSMFQWQDPSRFQWQDPTMLLWQQNTMSPQTPIEIDKSSNIRFSKHAKYRLRQRGVKKSEVLSAIGCKETLREIRADGKINYHTRTLRIVVADDKPEYLLVVTVIRKEFPDPEQ
jgi:hypothetical protein